MNCSPAWKIGVCSWSAGNDIESLAQIKEQTGISTMHLHIRPELGMENLNFIKSVIDQGWSVSCGMVSFDQEDYSTLDTIKQSGGILPDENWPQNKQKIFNAIDTLSGLSVKYLSFHFGFLGENDSLIQKVKILADYAGSKNVVLLMETGQETADQLAKFIELVDHPAIGINLDPANMILYGKGQPIESLDKLKKWIRHIHIKDAIASSQPNTWGTEVPWGHGQVNDQLFLQKLKDINYKGALCIERECGSQRLEDIIQGIQKVKSYTTDE